MGAGLYSGEPTGDPAGVPSDPECWSDDSKQSVANLFPLRPYIDNAYLCWRSGCRASDVFTAAEQKHTFEVQKANISQQRVLCRGCHREWVGLDREARACRQRWATERHAQRRDPEFLRRWLIVLESLPGYNGARDEGNIVKLRRLVAEQRHAEPGAARGGRRGSRHPHRAEALAVRGPTGPSGTQAPAPGVTRRAESRAGRRPNPPAACSLPGIHCRLSGRCC